MNTWQWKSKVLWMDIIDFAKRRLGTGRIDNITFEVMGSILGKLKEKRFAWQVNPSVSVARGASDCP